MTDPADGANEGVLPVDVDVASDVLRLRYWQLVLNEELKEHSFDVPVHVAIGHEAVAVAVDRSMGPTDQLVVTHRNMAFNLVRAGAIGPVRDEYLQKPTGAAGGILGSMNLAQPGRGVVYASSILGNNIPVAVGLSMAKDVLDEAGVVIVATGDGAMEEGTFYEGLVFARSHGLRLVVLVENNDHSMWSTIAERRCAIDVGDLAHAVGAPYLQLTGNNPFAYVDLVREARRQAEGQRCPVVIEAVLKNINNHAGATPGWSDDPKQISLGDGLVVRSDEYDPVHVLRTAMAPAQFDRLVEEVRTS